MKVNIIFWSGTGNTEAMAEQIRDGAQEAGAEVSLKSVYDAGMADIDCDVLCLGCPSMGDEVLEEGDFEPFITSIEGSVGGKKLALFGSYGWGDGQWMREWEERMKNAGAILICDGLMVCNAPEGDVCKTFGAEIVK